MHWQAMTPQARLRVGTRIILAVGFAAAIVIYVIAQPPAENPLGYDPMDTKKYLHDLEVYGGRANVVAAEFMDWFASLWHGQRLAFTVAAMTLLTTWVFRFFAAPLPEDAEATPDQAKPPMRLLRGEKTDDDLSRSDRRV